MRKMRGEKNFGGERFLEDIRSAGEKTASNSRKKALAKLNERERSGLKFRLLSSRFTCDRSSGKLEISEFPPSEFLPSLTLLCSLSLLPEELLRKA